MKLIFEPSVYLIDRPSINSPGLDKFLRDHTDRNWHPEGLDGDVIPEIAGRLCYMSFDKPRPGGNKAYLERIKEQKHGSVVEHPNWGFIFTGVSRTLTHELVRHRAGWGYSQLSQRYVDESVAEFVVPHDLQLAVKCTLIRIARRESQPIDKILTDYPDAATMENIDNSKFHQLADAGRLWMNGVEEAHGKYPALVDHLTEDIKEQKYQEYVALKKREGLPQYTADKEKWEREYLGFTGRTEIRKAARQAARSVLPNATETKIFATANARAIRHFLEMRCSRHAEPEIRKLAHTLWKGMMQEAPNLFCDYTEVKLPDETYELQTVYRKV